MLDFFNSAIFNIGNRAINTAQLVWMIMFLVSWVIVFRLFSTNGIKELYKKYEVGEKQQKKLRWILGLLLCLTSLILLSWLFKIDVAIATINDKVMSAAHLIKALCVIQAARLIDWTISNINIGFKGLGMTKNLGTKVMQGRKLTAKEVGEWNMYMGYMFRAGVSTSMFAYVLHSIFAEKGTEFDV